MGESTRTRVLIVCNYFAPHGEIAAIRTTKFAKYLKRSDCQVTVFAQENANSLWSAPPPDETLARDAEGIDVTYVSISPIVAALERIYKRVTRAARGKMRELSGRVRYNATLGAEVFHTYEMLHPLLASCDYAVRYIKNKSLANAAVRALTCREADFDVVFTSYGDCFGHLVGTWLKKKNPALKWIADFRDPVCRYSLTPKYAQWFARQYGERVYAACDVITTVSKGFIDALPERHRRDARLVYNGYDTDDKSPAGARDGRFMFCYTGRLYGGLYDASPLFEAVGSLVTDGSMDANDLSFTFAGQPGEFPIFAGQAAPYGLDSRCVYAGFLPRKESLKLQSVSRLLISITWDYGIYGGGVLTGKLIEYMRAGSPIIAIVGGSGANSEAAKIIREGRLGVAYEKSNAAHDMPVLKDYLKTCYEQYKAEGEIAFQPDKVVLDRFDYRNLSRQLIEIIEEPLNGGKR